MPQPSQPPRPVPAGSLARMTRTELESEIMDLTTALAAAKKELKDTRPLNPLIVEIERILESVLTDLMTASGLLDSYTLPLELRNEFELGISNLYAAVSQMKNNL